MSVLTDRAKNKVVLQYFQGGKFCYMCENDNFIFYVPVEDTVNEQGAQPKFLPEDKGIYFLKWIKKQMKEDERNKLAEFIEESGVLANKS